MNEGLKYSFQTTVKSYETDPFGRISLANILHYFQEAANHHATSLNWGMEYLESIQKFWVLSRLKLKIDKYPVHKDDITIETWSRGAVGFFAYRDYRVLLNGEACIDAVSSWLILDKNTHRPVKMDQIEKEIPGISESHLSFPDYKLPAVEATTAVFEQQVSYSDIDINLHVNNGKYVEIVLDALVEKLMSRAEITGIDIQYLYESQLNDIIQVFCTQDASALSLVNTTKGKETCRCAISWR
jgi:medium-chain acyl-[acyl-carrier-protein] hydrolase